jgi:hypothetical protein
VITIPANFEVQRVVFEEGVKYGKILHQELVNKKVFAPFSLVSLPTAELLSPYVMMTYDDHLQFAKYGMRTFINKGTVYYVLDLARSLTQYIGGPFEDNDFKAGMVQLIEDLGGYDLSGPLRVIPLVDSKDLVTVTYNTDARWVDYARTVMLNYVPYIIITNAVLDIMGIELFSWYRGYAVQQDNSVEHSKRVAAAIFSANSRMHNLLYASIRQLNPAYNTSGFVNAIDYLCTQLQFESQRAMKGLN